jgi:hypothetical protein
MQRDMHRRMICNLLHIKEVGAKKKKYHNVPDYGHGVEEDGTLTIVQAFH